MSKHKHLTLDERYQIQRSLGEGLSFRAIASLIGKDCTTISKEIRAHILFEAKGAPYRPFNDCLNRRRCSHFADLCSPCSRKRKTKCSFCGKGCRNCPDYRKEDCLLLRPPLMSAMAVRIETNVPWKNISMMPKAPSRNMSKSALNPVPDST